MMFKKMVSRVVEEHEEESRTVCDFCGEDIVQKGYKFDEVQIEARLGNVWPEGDLRVAELFDCCPQCWRNKVCPALEALSGKRCGSYDMLDGRLASETTLPDPERL